jgi:putative Holliday junction resolvase
VRILALDYGSRRTGVAISDETGTVARPLTVVDHIGTAAGMGALVRLIAANAPGLVVVGLPVSLDAHEHRQARAVRDFVARLEAAISIPVVTYDERFTTKVAAQRGGRSTLDARAAALILEDYLRSRGEEHG